MAVRRKYTREILQDAVNDATSVAGVLRLLGVSPTGGAHAHISRSIKSFGIDTSHFRRYSPAAHAGTRLKPVEILVVRPLGSKRAKPRLLTRALLEIGLPYMCTACGCEGTWQGKPLTLEVDHINGDYLDNRAENLRFLCPNCHRQTPNFAGRARRRAAATLVAPTLGQGPN